MDKYTIGKNIKSQREHLKMTQQELGTLIGVTSQTISGWESGYRLPDILILSKIAHICKTDINTFLEESDTTTDNTNSVTTSKNILHLTDKETQIISKLRTIPIEKRRAFETLLGIND